MYNNRILIIDDEESMRFTLKELLKKEGYLVDTAANGREGLAKVKQQFYQLVILDQKMPGLNGLEVLEKIKTYYPDLPVIMMTAYGTIEMAVKAMKTGAFDYLMKPFEMDEMKIVIDKAFRVKALNDEVLDLRQKLGEKYNFANIIGDSQPMQQVFKMVARVAPTDATVLLMGESGTGKELIANAIHYNSRRSKEKLIKVNCAALPDTLLESELFGHEKGAFTDARQRRIGKFEEANGGTIFLDEIGELNLKTQKKLLHVLQDNQFERVGGNELIKVDLRVIAATNKDLLREVKAGNFREDLYYRLNVFPIKLPPLRERTDDIPLLINHFLRDYSKSYYKDVVKFNPEAMQILLAYDWPGNVRELENVVKRAIILTDDNVIDVSVIRLILDQEGLSGKDDEFLNFETAVNNYTRSLIVKALKETKGNQKEAAKYLGMSYRSYRYHIQKFNIEVDNF